MEIAKSANVLRRVPPALCVPPLLIQPGIEALDTPGVVGEDQIPSRPDFTSWRHDRQKRRMPQCIAHRGHRAAYPENTLAAFRGAVEVGAHAIETDVHLTKDNVVVISHDATLKRCYGRNERIADSTWDEIKDSRTLQPPYESLPRLKDVLEYLAQPGLEEIWVLLDIKLSNSAEDIMRQIGSTIAEVAPSPRRAWNERIVLGIWAAVFLPPALEYVPGFPITHIGFSLPYARDFLKVENVSFNMLYTVLVGPGGRKFLQQAKQRHHRQVYTWTVNETALMEWCIRRQLDGVITDDPRKFLETCERFDERKKEPWLPLGLHATLLSIRLWVWFTLLGMVYWLRVHPRTRSYIIRKSSNPPR